MVPGELEVGLWTWEWRVLSGEWGLGSGEWWWGFGTGDRGLATSWTYELN